MPSHASKMDVFCAGPECSGEDDGDLMQDCVGNFWCQTCLMAEHDGHYVERDVNGSTPTVEWQCCCGEVAAGTCGEG